MAGRGPPDPRAENGCVGGTGLPRLIRRAAGRAVSTAASDGAWRGRALGRVEWSGRSELRFDPRKVRGLRDQPLLERWTDWPSGGIGSLRTEEKRKEGIKIQHVAPEKKGRKETAGRLGLISSTNGRISGVAQPSPASMRLPSQHNPRCCSGQLSLAGGRGCCRNPPELIPLGAASALRATEWGLAHGWSGGYVRGLARPSSDSAICSQDEASQDVSSAGGSAQKRRLNV